MSDRPYPWERECGHRGLCERPNCDCDAQPGQRHRDKCAVMVWLSDFRAYSEWDGCPRYITDPDKAAAVVEVLEAAAQFHRVTHDMPCALCTALAHLKGETP